MRSCTAVNRCTNWIWKYWVPTERQACRQNGDKLGRERKELIEWRITVQHKLLESFYIMDTGIVETFLHLFHDYSVIMFLQLILLYFAEDVLNVYCWKWRGRSWNFEGQLSETDRQRGYVILGRMNILDIRTIILGIVYECTCEWCHRFR